MKTMWNVAAMTATACLAGSAVAQTRSQVWGGPLTQQAQTVYVTADAGLTTYESEAAGSKETKESSTLTVGAWAGEGRLIGAEIKSSEAEVPFSLNKSSMKTSFRDVRMMARLAYLIPYVNVSLTEIDVNGTDDQKIGIYGTGMGAGMAVAFPLHDMLVVQAEGGTTTSTKVYDKLGQEAKMGRRDEADAHLSFDVTDRIVDLLVGYRVRRYELEAVGTKFKEESQGAYAGLRVGLYF